MKFVICKFLPAVLSYRSKKLSYIATSHIIRIIPRTEVVRYVQCIHSTVKIKKMSWLHSQVIIIVIYHRLEIFRT